MMNSEFISLTDSFKHDILGQPRTSKHKQYVILKGEWVYKGPYSQKKLENLKIRTSWFQRWQTPHMVLPVEILKTGDGIFVKYANLLSSDRQIETRLNTESFTGNQYRVIQRSDLVKLGKVLDSEDWIYSEYGQTLLLALIHMWILGTGDTGLFNILLKRSTRKVFVIDFDENSGREKENAEFYFSKPPGKKFQWYQNMKCYYRPVARELEKMLSDRHNSQFQERIQRGIQLLRRHSSRLKLVIVPRIELRRNQMNNGNSNNNNNNVNNGNQPNRNLGRMVWGGGYNSPKNRTYSGYPPDQVKSTLQKGIRRGQLELSLQAAFELWRLAEVIDNNGGTGISLQSNMYNRLAVIAAEDIGPCNPALAIYIINYVLTDVKSKTDRSPEKLASLVEQMVFSEKTRLPSHLWRAYADTEENGRWLSEKRGIALETNIDQELLGGYPQLDRFFLSGDPDILIPLAKMFHLRLSQRNKNAVYWLYQYIKNSNKLKVPARKRRTRPEIILWNMMTDFLDGQIVNTLSQAYFDLSGNRPIIMLAVTLILYSPVGQKVRLNSIDNDILLEINNWRDNPYLVRLLTGNYQFIVPEYAIDMHTREGKRRGKNRANFVQDGAVVTNESHQFMDEILAQIYIDS